MILLKTLRKKRRLLPKKSNNEFHSAMPVLRFVKNSEFMLNNFVTDKNNEYVCIIENDNNIILIMDNYDTLDIKPKKTILSKIGTFRCTPLLNCLNKSLYIYEEGSMFILEETYLENDDEQVFIGYTIKDLLTNNQQPTQAN